MLMQFPNSLFFNIGNDFYLLSKWSLLYCLTFANNKNFTFICFIGPPFKNDQRAIIIILIMQFKLIYRQISVFVNFS